MAVSSQVSALTPDMQQHAVEICLCVLVVLEFVCQCDSAAMAVLLLAPTFHATARYQDMFVSVTVLR